MSQGDETFSGYKAGEQLPLFEMPPVQASPAISQGLPKLQKLLAEQGINLKGFDELYTAAISIIRFTAAKEKQGCVINKDYEKGECNEE